MFLNLPPPLKSSSTIGLICPGGGFDDYKPIKRATKFLRKLGYKVKLGKALISDKKLYKYLSGSDKERIKDLENLWLDKSVDAIFCLKGGYGSLRLIKQINFHNLKAKKIFLGFSDITVLLLSIYARLKLTTFHGPLIGSKSIDKKSLNYLFKLLTKKDFNFSYSFKKTGTVISHGKAVGRLIGGNLTSICSMLETTLLPCFKSSILFLEDCDEKPYKIDRLLTQLENAGIFKQVKGILFGSFKNCGFKKRDEFIRLIKEKLGKYKIPIVCNFPAGHGKQNYTLPIGKEACLQTSNLVLKSI